jgi:hypothetical protein
MVVQLGQDARSSQNCWYLFLWALANDPFLCVCDLQQVLSDNLCQYNLLWAQDTLLHPFAIGWARHVVDDFAKVQVPKENPSLRDPLSM